MAKRDPTTGDILVEGGDYVAVDNPVFDAVALLLDTRQGSCFWDLTFGSRLHELPQRGMRAGIEREAENIVAEALQRLVDAGDITELTVTATRVGRSRLQLVASAFDTGRRQLQWTRWVAV